MRSGNELKMTYASTCRKIIVSTSRQSPFELSSKEAASRGRIFRSMSALFKKARAYRRRARLFGVSLATQSSSCFVSQQVRLYSLVRIFVGALTLTVELDAPRRTG